MTGSACPVFVLAQRAEQSHIPRCLFNPSPRAGRHETAKSCFCGGGCTHTMSCELSGTSSFSAAVCRKVTPVPSRPPKSASGARMRFQYCMAAGRGAGDATGQAAVMECSTAIAGVPQQGGAVPLVACTLRWQTGSARGLPSQSRICFSASARHGAVQLLRRAGKSMGCELPATSPTPPPHLHVALGLC